MMVMIRGKAEERVAEMEDQLKAAQAQVAGIMGRNTKTRKAQTGGRVVVVVMLRRMMTRRIVGHDDGMIMMVIIMSTMMVAVVMTTMMIVMMMVSMMTIVVVIDDNDDGDGDGDVLLVLRCRSWWGSATRSAPSTTSARRWRGRCGHRGGGGG
jgi:hypothetical protein